MGRSSRLKKLKNAEKVTRPDTQPPVADGWAGAVLVKVTRAFGQEQ